MGELLKAQLQEVRADENQTAVGDPVPVQFNPESLKLRLQNQTDGGRSRGRQRRQHNGSSSTSLSMDLVFDTADEGTDEAPVSVRTRTAIVEKYVLPKEDTSDAPPLLQFQWDQLIVTGVVESLDLEFDHFAGNGAPLRAKASVTIKEQDPKYTYVTGASGPAARDSANAQPAGSGGPAGAAPGRGTNEGSGAGSAENSPRSAEALDGESAPEFLARQGLDPSAWRGLGVDLSGGLELQAGLEVGFSASLGASLGVGVSAGVQASAGVSLEAALGIGASAVFSGSAGANRQDSSGGSSDTGNGRAAPRAPADGDAAGLALSAAGGLQPALDAVRRRETAAAADAARGAFGLAPPLAGDIAGGDVTVAAAAAESAGGRDPRATSYGYGVPLRPLFATAPSRERLLVGGARVGGKRGDSVAGSEGPAFRRQKTTPPWQALPRRDSARQLVEGGGGVCGCGGAKCRCGCGG